MESRIISTFCITLCIVNDTHVHTDWNEHGTGFEFTYKPEIPGVYMIDIKWDGRTIPGKC